MSGPEPVSCALTADEPLRCRIKKGWENAGLKGWFFGKITAGEDDRYWAIIRLDGSEDPDFHKAEGIEVECPRWVTAERWQCENALQG